MLCSNGNHRHFLSILLRSFSRDAGSAPSQKATPAPRGPGDDVTAASSPAADSRECTPESQAPDAHGQRITIVRQQQQVLHPHAVVPTSALQLGKG
jgi:hypothetical protein